MLRIPSCSLFPSFWRQLAFLYFSPTLPDLYWYNAQLWFQHLLRQCFSLNHHPFDQLKRLSIVGINNDLDISWFISRLHNFHNLQMLTIFVWCGVSVDVNLIVTIIILIMNIYILFLSAQIVDTTWYHILPVSMVWSCHD